MRDFPEIPSNAAWEKSGRTLGRDSPDDDSLTRPVTDAVLCLGMRQGPFYLDGVPGLLQDLGCVIIQMLRNHRLDGFEAGTIVNGEKESCL